MRSRKLWLLTAVLLLLGVGERAAPQDLLKRATFIASTKDWWGCRFHCDIGIQWVSDHEVFHAKFLGHYDPDKMGIEQRLTRVACLLDTRTRRERRAPALTAALDDLNPECTEQRGAAISPDGKWFVWSSRWNDCALVQMNGPVRRTYPCDDDGCYRGVIWLTDSRRWLELFGVNGRIHHLLLHDVRKPDAARNLPVAGIGERFYEVAWADSGDRAISLRPNWLGKRSTPVLEVTRLTLRGHWTAKRLAFVRVPGGRDYYTVAISPDGRRLAWSVQAAASKGRVRAEVWVTDLRGGHRRKLGAMPGEHPPGDARMELQWLPGGKRLSFVWSEKLYTVAAP